MLRLSVDKGEQLNQYGALDHLEMKGFPTPNHQIIIQGDVVFLFSFFLQISEV